MLFHIQGLFRLISDRYFVKEKVRSDGLHCLETLKIFTVPMNWLLRCFLTIKHYAAGLRLQGNRLNFRVCRPESAGWDMEKEPNSVWY